MHDSRVSARQPRSFWFGKRTQNHYRPASLNAENASRGRAGQLAALRQGPPIHESVHPGAGWQASVKRKWSVSGKWVLHSAFHRLSEIVADVDRSVSDDSGLRRRECLEIICNRYIQPFLKFLFIKFSKKYLQAYPFLIGA